MAKIILVCGLVCSGKSTYCKRAKDIYNAVVLAEDDITIRILGKKFNSKEHEMEIVRNSSKYIHDKAEEIALCGSNVMIENGYRSKSDRDLTKKRFIEKGIEVELHYIQVSSEQWRNNIIKRNLEIDKGESQEYYITDSMAEYLESHFDVPNENEIDVIVRQ